MNTLLSQVSPHTHSCTYNPEHLGAMFECPVKSVVYTVEKLCEVTNKIVTQIKSSNFQHILRVLLIKHYNDFPQRTLHGFLKILTIATSEAIAESQGSLIDALHLRYKNTDSDDRRVQKELQIRLMAPSPCSAEGEKLVQQVATRMARNHSFLKTTHGGMGAAIENFCKSQYRLPFKF